MMIHGRNQNYDEDDYYENYHTTKFLGLLSQNIQSLETISWWKIT